MHLSVSQISTLLKCGRLYELQYLDRVPVKSGGSLVKGGAYHAALEAYFHQQIHGHPATAEIAHQAFEASWQARTSQNAVAWGGANPAREKARGLQLVDAYLEQVAPGIAPAAVERRFEIELPGVEMPLVGVIDLIEQDGTLVDHKTAGKAWSRQKAAQALQPAAYMYAMRQLTGQAPVFRFDVAVDKLGLKKDPRVEFQRFELRPESLDFDFFEQLVLRAFQQIAIGIFPPNPSGWWCSAANCPVWEHCRGQRDGNGR